jgi:glycosidase
VEDFWVEVIPQVRQRHPHFLFLAEAYWDLEGELLQQGFDYCYDKRLYDRLRHEGAETVRLHLQADLAYQRHLVRFLENHDEPRAATAFMRERSQAAAVIMATLPGAKLLHQGQFEGHRLKIPVMLGRGPEEEADPALEGFYRKLLQTVQEEVFRQGEWHLCECRGWPDNPSYRNLLAYGWRQETEYRLVVVNLADTPSQGLIKSEWPELAGQTCRWHDLFRQESYERRGDELLDPGLFVALEPWGFHFLAFRY